MRLRLWRRRERDKPKPPPQWRLGLKHIRCHHCGRDLDWAQTPFTDLHPEPICGYCQTILDEEKRQRQEQVAEFTRQRELAALTGRETASELFRLANHANHANPNSNSNSNSKSNLHLIDTDQPQPAIEPEEQDRDRQELTR